MRQRFIFGLPLCAASLDTTFPRKLEVTRPVEQGSSVRGPRTRPEVEEPAGSLCLVIGRPEILTTCFICRDEPGDRQFIICLVFVLSQQLKQLQALFCQLFN